jgi:hypothetical protein
MQDVTIPESRLRTKADYEAAVDSYIKETQLLLDSIDRTIGETAMLRQEAVTIQAETRDILSRLAGTA